MPEPARLAQERAEAHPGGPWRVEALEIQAPGRLALTSHEEASLADGQLRVETLYSGLSAGTELTYYKGTNPYLHASWDPGLGVFRADQPAQRFPIRSFGYMEVGRVCESRTRAAAVGEVVGMAYGHKTGHTVDPATDRFVPLPDDLDPLLGIYVAHMGPICANGLLHAAADAAGPGTLHLGDGVRGRNVLVTGAGVIGLLTGLFARHHGAAAVAVADATPERLRAAERLGLDAFDDADGGAWLLAKERWRHDPRDAGADVVFQCRGRTASLATALRSLRPQGTVVDLAFYQGGAPEVRLGEEFHHNGLSIRCAQIARVPRGLAHLWDRRRLAAETVDLLRAHGPAVREHLVTDLVPLADAPALFADVAARRRHVIQAVFTC
ncbi:MAG TPA: zinc-binding alcohol dehydrogenase [Actinomycetes bacterium]|jgi:threonine dehydrogenase-like Zn-dependent dehydrogenase|nr:zinc-binding alcohol dehydrogenase [Actinomycetes bacterium]